MKTKIEKDISLYRSNHFKLIVTRPNIGAGTDHTFHCNILELEELMSQIIEVIKDE